MSTDQMSEAQQSSVSLGAGILVIAAFGLAKQLGWESSFDWVDGGLAALAVMGALSGLVKGAVLQAVASAGIFVGVMAYRHDLLQMDIGILFFGLLIVMGGGMVLNGLQKRS